MKYCPWCEKKNIDIAEYCTSCGKTFNVSNEPHQLPINTLLYNRYQVGVALRQGGFGITYVGCDTRLDKKVAIKEYFPSGLVNRLSEYSKDITISAGDKKDLYLKELKRFEEEARILALFSGEKHIVNVTDRFNENNTTYMVMEFVDGKDFDVVLEEKGKMSLEEAYRMLQPIIKTLGRVHKEGLVHRDISPANIKILPDGTPILLDFGAAREFGGEDEKSYSIILKPGYAPPEQYDLHGNQGSWSDVYAMCATIYKAITGITPQNSTTRIGNDSLKAPSECGAQISPAEEKILMKGLRLDIPGRIQTMEELDRDMVSAIEYNPTELFGKNDSIRSRNRTPKEGKKKNKRTVGYIGAGVIVLLIGLLLFFSRKPKPPISDTQSENPVITQENSTEMQNVAEIVTGSEVVLVGDTTNIKYRSNGLEYNYLEDVKYEVSDSKVAQIINNDELQQTLIKGEAKGQVSIKGVKGNEYGETTIIVGELDNNSNLVMSCDLNEILLYSDDYDGVQFDIALSGDVPKSVTANVYNSEGLDLNIEGTFNNRVLTLTVKDVASRLKSGTFTILMSDADDPGHVLGVIKMPIELVF